MKKLKSIDFKAFFINHGEKCGLGLIVLIVLLALSSTSWSRYANSPDDLKTKITDASNRIKSDQNVWPAAKQEQFAIVDFNGKAVAIFTGLAAQKYEFTTPMFWPLYRKKEKARQPELSPVQQLIAQEVVVVLENRPPEVAALDSTGESTRTDQAPSTLRPAPGAGGGGGPMTGPGPGGPAVPFGITPATAPPASGPRAGANGGRGAPTTGMATMTPGAGMGGMTGAGTGASARGERVIVVTGVVPLREQTLRMAKALNLSYQDASAAVEYFDFVLERQTAVAGNDPWSGEWEKLDNEKTIEILSETQWEDADPVPMDLWDSVLTSPLPKRLLHYWHDLATHPSIKHFQPTEAERQQAEALQEKVMEAAQKANLQLPPEKGGFARITNDIRGTTKMLQRQEGQSFMRDMESSMGAAAGTRMKASDIQDRLTATGRLFLFRFLDFEVQPGMAYRYRVKLILTNPNYKRNYDEVENEAFTLKPTIETEFSNISNAAVVPDTIRYFLKDVERDPVREEKHSKRPVANIAMFEWDKKLGTMLTDSLKIMSVGHFISEKKKSMVLDPVTPSFEEKEVPFVTDDILVDACGDLELSVADHPDLQMKAERGKKDVKIGMLQEALIATGLGELKKLDPVSQHDSEKSLSDSVKEERSNFLYLKDRPRESSNALDGGSIYGNTMPAPPGTPKPGGGNARRRQGSSSAGKPAAPGSPQDAHGGGPGGASAAPGGRPRPRN